jgi:prepilin-type N-terminal cleavage/methylation domain-containing protein
MKKLTRDHKGFTLLEIIVVLAVIGALAAMLAPVVFRYIDDAKRAQAQADVQKLAEAINQMYKDTGRWPFFKDATGKAVYTSGTDAALLSSNVACTGGAATCDTTVPTDTTTGGLWKLTGGSASLTDNLSDQLIFNTPFGSALKQYALTGGKAWKGPYLATNPAVDPWGRSYLVNVVNADPAKEGFTTQAWVIAISAGSNGTLETDPTQLLSTDPVVSGDDIVARVK